MEVRTPTASDGERVQELVRGAMQASYAMSPEGIRAVVEERFAPAAVEGAAESDDTVAAVAEDEGAVAGYVEAAVDDGEVRWLFVDPDHRGKGVGSRLFERARAALSDHGVGAPRASTRQANQEGRTFFERFGYEEVGERTVEVAGRDLVEYVYAPAVEDAEKSDRADSLEETETAVGGGSAADHGRDDGETWAETDFPGTEMQDGRPVATTTDGETVHVEQDAPATGQEAPFFPAYTDAGLEERYGFYCGACGSLDVLADEMEALECSDCGNHHAADEEYDGSYL